MYGHMRLCYRSPIRVYDDSCSASKVPTQGSKLTFLLGSTGVPNFKKLGAPTKNVEAPQLQMLYLQI